MKLLSLSVFSRIFLCVVYLRWYLGIFRTLDRSFFSKPKWFALFHLKNHCLSTKFSHIVFKCKGIGFLSESRQTIQTKYVSIPHHTHSKGFLTKTGFYVWIHNLFMSLHIHRFLLATSKSFSVTAPTVTYCRFFTTLGTALILWSPG